MPFKMVDASVSTRLLPSVLNYYALGRDLSCVMLIQRVRLEVAKRFGVVLRRCHCFSVVSW